MVSETSHDLESSDLPVVQYLDQRITFDLLATLEDGFSHFTTIETQSSGSASTESSGQAGIGVSNVFAFLGVDLSGKRAKGTTETQGGVTTATLVHTPSSLFARLRSELSSRNLVHPISKSDDLAQIKEGYFVEFEATLHRIQILELLDAFAVIVPLVDVVGANPDGIEVNQGKTRRTNKKQANPILAQIDSMRKAITAAGSLDLVAKVGGMNFVLTAGDGYFIDPTMNGVLDGTFRVFGKATRVVTDEMESVNLLRRSPFGKFPQIVQQLSSVVGEFEFEGGVPDTKISGPTLQAIPIAIFA